MDGKETGTFKIPTVQFRPDFPELLSQNLMCYRWLDVPGNSEMLHCRLFYIMPYYNSYSDPYLRVCIHSLMLGRLYSITVSNSDGVNNILVILLSLMNWQS